MNKFKIILDSSVIYSISNKDIAALKQYQIYITPTNMFEIFTHSEANKIKNPKEFIVAVTSQGYVAGSFWFCLI